MVWWPTLLAGLVTVAGFWVPGVAVLAVLGCRGLRLAALAPAVTAGLFALGAVLSDRLGVAWGALPAGVLTLTTTAGLLALRRVPARAWPPPAVLVAGSGSATSSRRRWLLPAAIGVAVAAQLGPVMVGMGRPDRVQNAWDALFHLAALQQIRAGGGAGPLQFAGLLGDGAVYPQGWHAVAGLVPAWGEPVLVTNVAAFLPCALATALGTGAAARAIFRNDTVATVATLMLASGVALPLAIALQPGLIPNAFGMALLPAGLAAAVDASRRQGGCGALPWAPIALAALGIATVHPNAAVALCVLAAPWLLPVAVRAWRAAWAHRQTRAPAVLVAVAAVACVTAVLTSRTFQVVAETRVKPPVALWTVATNLATGNLGEWTSYAILPTLLAAGGTLALVRRRPGRAMAIALTTAVALYACAASSWAALSALATPWYVETRRLAPVVGMLTAVVAGWALTTGVPRLASRLDTDDDARRRRVATGLVCATVLVTGVPAAVTTHGLAVDTFSQDMPADPQPFDRKPYLTADEEAMLGRLEKELDASQLLLGSPLSGAGHLAAFTGQRVAQPYHSIPLDRRAAYISDHLADLGTDPSVCAAVRELDAHYVYVDPYPLHSTYWTAAYAGTFTAGPPLEPIDAGGDSSVYSLDICYPAP